jgi:hypothetical protein
MKDQLFSDVTGIPVPLRSYQPDGRWVLPQSNIGVELELENAAYLANLMDNNIFWRVIVDDSLRNDGFEFLFAEPLSGADLSAAIQQMSQLLSRCREKGESKVPDPHYRTSTHVHMDVRECTMQQYMNIILLSIMFESALFRFAGPEREHNNFSMSSRYASGYFEQLSLAYNARHSGEVVRHLTGMFKYSAINVAPPFVDERNHPRKGSIEFRHHAGCIDMQQLQVWINILMCIKKAACNQELFTPKWMQELSGGGLTQILKDIFGEYAPYLLYPQLEVDCLEGVRLVQDVIHSARLNRNIELAVLDADLHKKQLAKKVERKKVV